MDDLVDAVQVHRGGFQPLAARSLHNSRVPSSMIWRAKLLLISTSSESFIVSVAIAASTSVSAEMDVLVSLFAVIEQSLK